MKQLFRRTAALMLTALLLWSLPLALVARAEGSQGYWEQFDVQVTGTSHWEDGWYGSIKYYRTAQSGQFSQWWVCTINYYSMSGTFLYPIGDYSKTTVRFTPPPAVIQGGQTVSIPGTLAGNYQKRSNGGSNDPSDLQDGASMDAIVSYGDSGWDYAIFDNGSGNQTLYTSWEAPTIQRAFTCEIRSGKFDGEEMYIRVSGLGSQASYFYRWHDTSQPENPEATGETVETTAEPACYWKHDGVKVEEHAPVNADLEAHEYTYSALLHDERFQWAESGDSYLFHYDGTYYAVNPDSPDQEELVDALDWAEYRISATGLRETYLPGETVRVRLMIEGAKSPELRAVQTVFGAAYPTEINPDPADPLYEHDSARRMDSDSGSDSALHFSFYPEDAESGELSLEVSGTMPDRDQAKPGDVMYIVLRSEVEGIYYLTGFRYVFVEGTGSGGDPIGGGGEETGFDGGGFFKKVDRRAWEKSGEDGGVSIPIQILVGTFGTVLGTAAAAASRRKGKKKQAPEEAPCKLYIKKDFGDAIRKGAAPVSLSAYIDRITEGGSRLRDGELTSRLALFSETQGLTVEPQGVNVSVEQAALVQVPDPQSGLREGVVTARVSAAGGWFEERVHFRLVGEPYLTFATAEEPITALDSLTVLAGSNQIYHFTMNARDFLADATRVRIQKQAQDEKAAELVGVSFERTDRFSYLIHVANYTRPEDFRVGAKTVNLEITVSNDQEQAKASFPLFLTPEGIAVLAPELNREGQMVINTEDADPGEATIILPTEIRLLCTYRKEGRLITETSGFNLRELVHTDARTLHLIKGFQYELNDRHAKEGLYYFAPKRVIPVDPDRPYLVQLPIYHPAGGQYLKVMLPVRLEGEPIPAGTVLPWDKEYALLQRACQRYGLGAGENAQTAVNLIRSARGGLVTAGIMHQITRAILEEAHRYYELEAEANTQVADQMNRAVFVLSTAKWLGDQALSFLIKTKCGKYGNLVELIVMPVKDTVVDTIGQSISAAIDGESLELCEKLKENGIKNLTVMVDNAILGTITAILSGDKGYLGTNYGRESNKPSAGWIVAMIAGYYAYLVGVHYTTGENGEKDDPYLSMAYALEDISMNSLKQFLSVKFGEALSKGGSTTRRTAADGRSVFDSGEGSIIDKMTNWFFSLFRDQNNTNVSAAVQAVKDAFYDSIQSDKAFAAAFDSFLDVVLKSADATVHTLWKTDKTVVLKCGDGELDMLSLEWFRILTDAFVNVAWKLCCLWEPLAGLFRSNSETSIRPQVIPFTPEEEAQALLSQYHAEPVPGINA